MRYRLMLRPLQLVSLASLCVAAPLHGQDAFSGDTTPTVTRQAGKTDALAQATQRRVPPRKPAPQPRTPKRPAPKPAPRSTPPPAQGSFSVPVQDMDDWTRSIFARSSSKGNSKHRVGGLAIVNYFGAGYGLEYLYEFRSWADVGGHFGQTQARLKTSKKSDTQESLVTSLSTAKGFVRIFRDRTLYGGAALGLASLSGQYGWQGPGVTTGSIKSRVAAQLVTTEIFAGSEWHLGWGIYAGVDWVGFGVPLYGSLTMGENPELDVTTSVLTGATPSARVRQEIAAQLKFYYLLARVGWSF